MSDSDEELFQRFQKGSRHELQLLAGRYDAALFRFFARRVRSSTPAADLVQETFVVLLRTSATIALESTFRSYLYGIAFRVLFAANRRERKQAAREVPLDQNLPAGREDDSPDRGMWVRQILDRMDGVEREVLMLREYEQLSYDEIAELLRIPLNTVRSRLFRARMAFRKQCELQGRFTGVKGGTVCQ